MHGEPKKTIKEFGSNSKRTDGSHGGRVCPFEDFVLAKAELSPTQETHLQTVSR